MPDESRMRVLVIEDDGDEVTKLRDYLELCPDMEFIGSTGSSGEGIRLTRELRPDAVILDLELDEGHGLYYLNAWRAAELRCDPLVLVLTACSSYHTLDAALERGVDCRFFKGKKEYQESGPEILVDFIREIAPNGRKRTKLCRADALRGDIEYSLSRLKDLSGNTTLSYLVEAIYLVSRMHAGGVNLTRDVYPLICRKYGKDAHAVQRGISYCVEELYNKADPAELAEVYPPELNEETNKPQVKRFILWYAKRYRDR